jgi:acyl-CoA synthetase (AMP-forming)/AMP-acid ligase II
MDCRIAGGSSGLGAIEVTGRSMFSGYVGAGPPFRAGGWFRTGDLGILIDGQLYLAGRYDDRIIVAGRNVDATQIEASVSGKGGIRHGGAAAVEDDEGGFVVVAETAEVPDPRQIADAVRDTLVRATGLAPSAVIFVPRRSLPKTPSGKLQRYRVRSLIRTGQLEQMAVVWFRGEAR